MFVSSSSPSVRGCLVTDIQWVPWVHLGGDILPLSLEVERLQMRGKGSR